MRKYWKFTKKLTAVMLCISILLSASNFTVTAEEETKSDITQKETQIVKEIVEKRTATEKHFLLDDGTFEATMYSKPVHYKVDEAWRTIDNRMAMTKDDNGKEVYQNTENRFAIKLSKYLKEKELVSLKKDNYEIVWGVKRIKDAKSDNELSDLKNVEAEYEESSKNDLKNISEDEKKKIVQGVKSEINYDEIYKDVKLQYITESSQIKENIIVKSPMTNPEFTFTLSMKNLIAKLNDDKTIVFYDANDKDNIVYKMEAPYMYDDNNETSKEIEIKLIQSGNEYQLTVIPDNNWLNDSKRAYPVVIDPTIETLIDQDEIQDAQVDSKKATTNYGGEFIFSVGHTNVDSVQRAFIRFDGLPVLANAYKIDAAYLETTLQEGNNNVSRIDAYEVGGGWSSWVERGAAGITWNRMPVMRAFLSSASVGGYKLARFKWDITGAVKDWYSGVPNNGIMLQNYNEMGHLHTFYSKDTTEVEGTGGMLARPLVRIHYSFKDGIKQYLGRVEAESFGSSEGSIKAIRSDDALSAGHYVGNIANEGEYIVVNVNSRRSGLYETQFMFRSKATSQIAEVTVNESEKDASVKNVKIDYSGGEWSLTKAQLKLHKGLNKIKIKAYKGISWQLDYIDFVHKLPDIIEAENFDTISGVEVIDEGNVRRLGGQQVGEFFDYKVDVEKAGLYRFVFNVASETNTGAFILKDQNGKKLQLKDPSGNGVENVMVPNTGAYNKFKPVSYDIYLTKDITKLKFEVTGPSSDIDNFECHYIGPRTFQAEETYDFYGTTYLIDDNGSQYVGAVDEGDYVNYKVILKNEGTYNLNLKAASLASTSILRVENAKGEILEKFIIPATDDDNKWIEVNKNIKLLAGDNILKLVSEHGNLNLDGLDISHVLPKELSADDFSDTNTATVANSLLNLKESEYVDYNVFSSDDQIYTIELKSASISKDMAMNIENSDKKVLAGLTLKSGSSQTAKGDIKLKSGVTKLRLYAKSGGGDLSKISINKKDAANTETVNNTEPTSYETISDKMPMNQARAEHIAEEINGKIYAIGGKNNFNKGILRSVEEYDPQINTWTNKSDMPEGLYGAASAKYNNKIYVMGGTNSKVLSSVYVYDPTVEQWQVLTNLPTARSYSAACELDGKIYVIGGYDGTNYVNKVEIYDVNNNTWMSGADLPVSLAKISAKAIDGSIYVMGGTNLNLSKNLYVYDKQTNTWSTDKEQMKSTRKGFDSLVYNKKIYIIGGWGDSILNSIEEYDPTPNLWTINSGIMYGRSGLRATSVGDDIYITGGKNFNLGGCLALNEHVSKMPQAQNPKSIELSTKTIKPYTVSLIWTNDIDSTKGYKVFRDGKYLKNITNVKSFNDKGLAPNKQYTYQLKAINKDGVPTELSNTVAATTAPAYTTNVSLNQKYTTNGSTQRPDLYSDTSNSKMSDGKYATSDFSDSNWTGWLGADPVEFTYDLGTKRLISGVELSSMVNKSSGIDIPKGLEVYATNDLAKDFKLVGSASNYVDYGKNDVLKHMINVDLDNTIEARYVKVKVNRFNKDVKWLFLDEINLKAGANNVAKGKTYISSVSANSKYPDTGGIELTNGVGVATDATANDYLDSQWQARYDVDSYSYTIDLNNPYELNHFCTIFYNVEKSDIYLPGSVSYAVSNDKVNFVDIGKVNKPNAGPYQKGVYRLTLENSLSARYIRVTVNDCIKWSFVDEFVGGYGYNMHMGVSNATKDKAYTTSVEAGSAYPDSGKVELTNGALAGNDYKDGQWQGRHSNDKFTYDFIVDLTDPYELNYFTSSFFKHEQYGIYLPDSVKYAVSDDNINFVDVGKVYKPYVDNQQRAGYTLKLGQSVTAKYVRLTVEGANISYIDEFTAGSR